MGALTFSSLPALLLAAAVPVAALAYRLRKPGKRRLVASLMLFQDLVPRSHRRRRIEVPIRFLFEALAMLLIVLAIGGIALRSGDNHIILLIDNSLSMSASLGGDQGGSTNRSRLDLAKERIAQFVDQQSANTSFDLYRLSPTLERLSEAPVGRGRAIAIARQIEAAHAPGLLGGAVEQIRKTSPSSRIVIVSDHTLEPIFNEDGSAGGLPKGITLLNTFEASPNAFFTAIHEEQQLSQRRSGVRTVVATAELSSAENKSVPFRAELFLAKPPTAGSGNRSAQHASQLVSGANSSPLTAKTITLRDSSPQEISFDVPISSTEQTALLVKLSPANPQTVDSISTDNLAYIVLGSTPEAELLFVSDRYNKTSGLERLPFISVRPITTSEYQSLSSAEIEKFRAIIFHQFVPVQLPRKPTLFIAPPAGNALFPVATVVTSRSLSSWNENHPLLLYLNLSAFKVPGATVFQTPAWAQSIVRVEEGTVLLAGESGGVRLVGSGIELIPYERAQTPGPSILLLNTLKWMLGGGSFNEANTAIQLRAGEQIIAPDGTPLTSVTSDDGSDESKTAELQEAGIYLRVTKLGGTTRSEPLAHNRFLVDESRTGNSPSVSFTAASTHQSGTNLGGVNAGHEISNNEQLRPLWKWCLSVAAILLFLDLLLALSLRSDPSRRRTLNSLFSSRVKRGG